MAARRKTGNVTLKDIAQATGFSANTVSRALADKPDISEETKAVIREKASQMGYIANALASFLRSGVSRNIAILVGDISNPHFSVMVKEMQTLLQRRGYNSIIFNTEEKAAVEKQAITTSLSQNVDGIILCPAPGGEENIRFLQMHGKPFVMIGRHFSGEDASFVICDDVHGGYAAARYLLDRGHKDILFLNGPRGISSSAERLEGYRAALEEKGIAYRSELVQTVPVTSRRGTEKMRDILSQRAECTAVLVFTSLSQNVDGIILCPAPGGEENIRFLQMHGKPFVMIGRHFSGEDASFVICDDVHGGYAAARYLLDRGHKDILFLNGPRGISSSAERLEGYRAALEEKGIAYRSELVQTVPVTSRRGTEKMRDILSQRAECTAVLVFNDILAWQVICILGELGRKVPEQCSVVGFDNIKYPYPVHLTSVSSSKTTMAKRSVEILLKKLEGQKGAGEECVVLETDVVEGGTVAVLNEKR